MQETGGQKPAAPFRAAAKLWAGLVMGAEVKEERCEGASLGQAGGGAPARGEQGGVTWWAAGIVSWLTGVLRDNELLWAGFWFSPKSCGLGLLNGSGAGVELGILGPCHQARLDCTATRWDEEVSVWQGNHPFSLLSVCPSLTSRSPVPQCGFLVPFSFFPPREGMGRGVSC